MPAQENNRSTGTQASAPQPSATTQLTPELVQKVTERVYALLMDDLRREFERGRRGVPGTRHLNGGR